MIPLVGRREEELKFIEDIVVETAEKIESEKKNSDIQYHIRYHDQRFQRAALMTIEQDRGRGKFFSFGTNDLTQMTFKLLG